MYKSRLHRFMIFISMVIGMSVMSACSQPVVSEPVEQGGFVKIAPGAYDSVDTAIVVAKQEKQKKITFFNLKKQKNYTLNYDGITKFTDKYGSQISVSQLEEGEVVDIQFLKDEKLLASLNISSDIWTMDDVSKYELDLKNGKIKVMNEEYTLEETTVVFSNGEAAELLDIGNGDNLCIKGKDYSVYSISIENGHGYLRLENEDYFIGGWIEVGQKIIHKIEEDMLLAVPEGAYTVYLSNIGIEGTKEVEIKRNQETSLDVGDLKKEDLIKYGNLIITVEPSSADVFIDGKQVDTNRVIKAAYGLHQIMAKAEGYDTVIQYIRVNEKGANIAITLDEETQHSVSENSAAAKVQTQNSSDSDTIKENSVSSNNAVSENKNTTTEKKESENSTVSGNSTVNSGTTTGYKVSIESPSGAEVYVDGNYIGIIPASFAKKSGNHEVTIRKSGYLTRTYTINVDDENKDIGYSFSDLTPIE